MKRDIVGLLSWLEAIELECCNINNGRGNSVIRYQKVVGLLLPNDHKILKISSSQLLLVVV